MNTQQSRVGTGFYVMAASALALGCSLYAGWFAIGDPDLGLHLALGRFMNNHGVFPPTDPFTYTTSQRPFINFEWGFDYAIYGLYSLAGSGGLLVGKLLILALLVLLILKLADQLLPENPALARWFSALIVVAALPVVRLRLVERPHLIGFLFLFLHLYMARGFSDSQSPFKRKLFFFSLISSIPIWAALHGSWPLALAVTGAHGLFNPKERKPYAALFILQIIAATLNPYGFELLLVPFRHLGSSEVSSFITEWMSPELSLFSSHVPIALGIVVGFGFCTLLIRNSRDKPELLVAAALIILAARSFRFVSPALLVMAAPMGARIAKATQQASPALQRIIHASAMLLCLGSYYGALTLQPQALLQGWHWETKGLPRAAATTITSNDLPGPIFNDFDFGDDLCWTLGSAVPHAIDGRVDLFGNDFLNDYVEILQDPSLFSDHVAKYNPQLVLLAYPTPRNHKLVAFLTDNPEYLLIHLDDTFAVWARDKAKEDALAKNLGLNRFRPVPDIPQALIGAVDDTLANQLERVALASDQHFANILRAEFWWRKFEQDESEAESSLLKIIDHTNQALTEKPGDTLSRVRRGQALLRLRDPWQAWPDLLYTQAPHTPASMRADLPKAISQLPPALVRAFIQPLLRTTP